MLRTLLLDTSSLAYRAFFAVPQSVTDGDGRPVNAVRGYLDMTAQLVRDLRPDEVVHVYDHDWRPAPRVAAYAGYKSTRREEPEAITEQFALLREVLDALGMAQAQAEGWEADDAIATLCTQATGPIDVVTGDRDLIQLVHDDDPPVRVLFTVKGVKQLAVFDEAGVRGRYGIPPQRYADFATLRGDPSDGLPGVKGVGEKTARELVRAYPSLDALVAAAAEQPPALARRLRESRDYLAAMRAVVPVRCDVDVEVRRPARDEEALAGLAQQRRLETPVQRLREALGG